MIRYGAATLAALVAGGAAQAADLSPTELVNRHMAAAARADIDAMMADYTDDAIALQAGQASQGKPAIRAVFERIFPKPAAGVAPTAGGAPAMKITRVWEEGNVGFVTWQAGAVNGTDEFIIRGGKIAVQAVFLSGAPPVAVR